MEEQQGQRKMGNLGNSHSRNLLDSGGKGQEHQGPEAEVTHQDGNHRGQDQAVCEKWNPRGDALSTALGREEERDASSFLLLALQSPAGTSSWPDSQKAREPEKCSLSSQPPL